MHNLVMSGVASLLNWKMFRSWINIHILFLLFGTPFISYYYYYIFLRKKKVLGKHFEKARWFSNRSYNMSWNRSTVQIPVWMQEAGNDFQKITELLLYLSFHFSHPSSKNWDISLIFSMSLHLAKEKHHLLSSSSISFFKVWVSSMKLRAWSSSIYNE